MPIDPTDEQKTIIEEHENCVVIARPGSGKTTTMALKIQNILVDLPFYKGVIAISFTNKASNELERKSHQNGADHKNSFFGTIDKFFISEIIFPFGERVFGKPNKDLVIKKFTEIEDDLQESIQSSPNNQIKAQLLGTLFGDGVILVEYIGILGLYILFKSKACSRYLKARFSHIIIDEYQDCDIWQHRLFVKLIEIGLIGVAVGDIDQSIFAFAEKSPEYLKSLGNRSDFITHILSKNHRSHISIINYATKLISNSFTPIPTGETNVFYSFVDGSEIETADWLTSTIPTLIKRFNLEKSRDIGILVKNHQTGQYIHQNLKLNHKLIINTPLDEDSSLWGSVFRKVLFWSFNTQETKYELCEHFLNFDYQEEQALIIMEILSNLENLNMNELNSSQIIDFFTNIAQIIYPSAYNDQAITKLKNVLSNEDLLSSFMQPQDDEIQLMTLHKSKGLEFDLVFHLNLHKFVLPQYNGNYSQDLNLHYVGITRARKGVILCSSTKRLRNGIPVDAEPSEFLFRNDLGKLRDSLVG